MGRGGGGAEGGPMVVGYLRPACVCVRVRLFKVVVWFCSRANESARGYQGSDPAEQRVRVAREGEPGQHRDRAARIQTSPLGVREKKKEKERNPQLMTHRHRKPSLRQRKQMLARLADGKEEKKNMKRM